VVIDSLLASVLLYLEYWHLIRARNLQLAIYAAAQIRRRSKEETMTRDVFGATSSGSNCPFCKPVATIKNTLPGGTPCERDIYEDESTFAVLCPQQYTAGHTLLILKDHKTDITDDISPPHLMAFIMAIHKVAVRLKESALNSSGESPERIYVCALCDGVKHLHAHLIPRYPFTSDDEKTYRETFKKRDGEAGVEKNIAEGDMGGFWYVAEREKDYKHSAFGQKSSQEQAQILQELANQLRIP
jgi:diadenosine tetraphosphate (Ap4A) HIT family hydrolase